MRITLITETYPPEINGVARTLHRLVEELRGRQHQIHIIRPAQKQDRETAPDSQLSSNTQTSTETNESNGRAKTTLVKGIPLPGYAELQFGVPSGNTLKQLWLKQPPDIIYVATEGPLGWSAVRQANRLGIPVISGFHTNFDAYSQHYRLGFIKPIIFSYLKRLHNRTLCTLAPSSELVDTLRQRGIAQAELFSRGIDTQLFSPAYRSESLRSRWQQSAEDLILLYVGRIAAEKNIHTVIRSYDAMRERHPGVRLVMVGDGPLRKALQRQRKDIYFSGCKTGDELSAHYASADIFLFASTTETFGNVVLEAMASGLLVIGFDYAATQMHIEHGINGYAVPMTAHEQANYQQFEKQCIELLGTPAQWPQLREAARQTAEGVDWSHIIDAFENKLFHYVNPEQNPEQQTFSTNTFNG